MSNKWIPTAERLPGHREFIEAYDSSNYGAAFLVTIEGAEKATTLYYSQTGMTNREIHTGLWRGCRFRKGIRDNGRR